MQILAFLARRGKGSADRFTGKNRDAVESACGCCGGFYCRNLRIDLDSADELDTDIQVGRFCVRAGQPVHVDLQFL